MISVDTTSLCVLVSLFFLQELIPLILCTACRHPEPKERDQLLHILFNLIKRPDDEQRLQKDMHIVPMNEIYVSPTACSHKFLCVCFQRQMILTGCVAFAKHVGPTRVEAELLPQCWEQVESPLCCWCC